MPNALVCTSAMWSSHAQGYAWAEDKEHCEEYGRLLSADPTKVSQRAKKRGLSQVGPPPRLQLAAVGA